MIENGGIQEVGKTATNGGWFDLVKERLQFDKIVNKAWESKSAIVDVILYGSIGFLGGFLFKKYSQYLIFFILFVVGLLVLQQFNIVSIVFNWQKIHTLMGTQPTGMMSDNLLILGWEWFKKNMVVSVSFIIGFLLGLKLG